MEAQDFCYWLQGFFELSEGKKLTPKQVEIIKDHLNLVFDKVTPDRSEKRINKNLINIEQGVDINSILDVSPSTAGNNKFPNTLTDKGKSRVCCHSSRGNRVLC